MTLTDKELLDFNAREVTDLTKADARRLLREHGDVYRAQLAAALWLDQWRERQMRFTKGITASHGPEWYEGFEYVLLELAAHFRQGDFLPGGDIQQQMDSR
jgi:hypothetical protein